MNDYNIRTLLYGDEHSQTANETEEVKRAARKRMTERLTRAWAKFSFFILRRFIDYWQYIPRKQKFLFNN